MYYIAFLGGLAWMGVDGRELIDKARGRTT